jgi:hypothetical protein
MRMNLLKLLRNQKLAMSISIFVVFYFLICVPYAVAIETASLNFSPSQNEARAGKVLNIKVTLNTGGQAVNAVQADISYPLSIFDPNKSKVNCIEPFPTKAQNITNSTININGTKKGMVKLACAVAVADNSSAKPFTGEVEIATLSLHVRESAPSIHNSKMLGIVIDNDLTDGHNNYSAIARATDSKNILGNVGVADITVISNNNTYSTLDINNDTEIDSKDLAALITDFGKESSKSDVNKDKIVNTIDLSILLSNQF